MQSLDDRIWEWPLARCFAELGAAPSGLTEREAQDRLRRFGSNIAITEARQPLWLQFLLRFANPLILILLLASLLSALMGDLTSFVLILLIIAGSVVLDFVQEVQAGNAAAALRAQVALKARVLRDGAETERAVESVVPGDVVRLSAGDLIPADCRLLESKDLFVNQALLTGEAYPAEKRAEDLAAPASNPDQAVNTAFMGTSVVSGAATALVARTGRDTALGGLAGTLATAPPPTAFERGVRRFGLLILRFTIFLVLFVLLANVVFHRPWLTSLMFALALAVGLTPELLPMVVTVTLARGAVRLARQHVIVKRLAAMHNLGAMDVLCTDKTGTLTEAKIRLARHIDPSGRESERVFELAYLNSYFETGIRSPLDEAILGHQPLDASRWRKLDEVPFDFERRRVSVLVADETDARLLIVKGAPEDVLKLATAVEDAPSRVRPLDAADRVALQSGFERLGEEGFRALAIGWRAVGPDHSSAAVGDEAELVFAGYAAFLDPPKASAGRAILSLAEAGVAIKILTGDNERVTRHVCGELGIDIAGMLTGDELSNLSDEALLARLDRTTIFCRVTPQQKLRVLLALKRRGRTVGFLGDGINDASALHAADVGISVDSAVDVAKDAAELILLDQDLSVVHQGVLEGRRSVVNVTKYILMGASSNFGNMFSMAGAALFLPFLPMLPTQVLLNNLLYDASEVGVPFDNVDPEAVERPVHWDLGLIQRFMFVLGPVSSLFDFLTFAVLLYVFRAGERLFQTGWFIESLATQSLVVLVIRTWRNPLRSRPHPILAGLSLGAVAIAAVLPITPVAPFFGFVAPPTGYYLFVLSAAFIYLALVEMVKRVLLRRSSGAHAPIAG